MSAKAPAREVGADLLALLAAEIGSAERMLALVIAQGEAIRKRDVRTVVRCVGLLQGELVRREELERERNALLQRSAALLGVGSEQVTVEQLGRKLDPAVAAEARARSAKLRGLVEQLQREHTVNRALMRVELAFLEELLSHLQPQPPAAYELNGEPSNGRPSADLHLLDMEA